VTDLPVFIPVARVERPSRDAFARSIVARQRPVVITGALQGWDEVPLWSVELLSAVCRSPAVGTQLRWGRGYGDVRHESMELGRFIELMRNGESLGKRGLVLPRPFIDFPELERRLPLPEYLLRARRTKQFLFVTPMGFTSPLHYDVCHNLLAQFCGRKRVVLIDPRHRSALYHPPVWRRDFWASPVDPDQPDLRQYPAFAGVPRYECVLEPSQVLFIPGGWRHHVVSLEESISVSFFWEHSLRQAARVRALKVLGRRRPTLSNWLKRALPGWQ
jgi:hypothetical protein